MVSTIALVGLVICGLFVVRQGVKWRLIHDARPINTFLKDSTTRYESLDDLRRYPGARFCTKLDLQSAYRQIRVHASDWPLLGIRLGELFAWFVTLPFGLSHSPARFCDAVRPAVEAARRLNCKLIWYMDDILVLGDDRDEVARSLATLYKLLRRLNLRVAPDKFFPTVSRSISFLGAHVDLVDGTYYIAPAKLTKLAEQAAAMAERESIDPKELQSVLGVLAFGCGLAKNRVVSRRALDDLLGLTARFSWKKVALSPLGKEELLAIAALRPQDLTLHYRADVIRRKGPWTFIWTDASDTGWGAYVLPPGTPLGDKLPPESLRASSVEREITALTEALLASKIRNRAVLAVCDARAAVAAISNNNARTAGTAAALIRLQRVLTDLQLSIDIEWCARDQGMIPFVDAISKERGVPMKERCKSEYSFNKHTFSVITRLFKVEPTVDLFACNRSHLCERYCCRMPTPSWPVTGHTMPLEGEIPWVYPPWSQARRFLGSAADRGCKEFLMVVRTVGDSHEWTTLDTLVQMGEWHIVQGAVLDWHPTALHHTITGHTPKDVTPGLAVVHVRRRRASARPKWWSREELIKEGIEQNPGPSDADLLQYPKAVPAPALLVPSVAAVLLTLRAAGETGSIPWSMVQEVLGASLPPDPSESPADDGPAWGGLLEMISSMHNRGAVSTKKGYKQSAKQLHTVLSSLRVHPAAPWSDELACTCLASMACNRGDVGIAATTIKKDIAAARAILSIMGAPVLDSRKSLTRCLFRLGCYQRSLESKKEEFTLEHLLQIHAHLKKSPLWQDPRTVCALCGCAVAFALCQRGEVIRNVKAKEISITEGVIQMNFSGPSKVDQRFVAAAPRGTKSASALRLAVELLQQWLTLLPPGWTGRMFPTVSPKKPTTGTPTRHMGLWWLDAESPGARWNASIKSWCQACGIEEHLTFHCLRVGGASSLFRECRDIQLVKDTGGWLSDVVFQYCKRRCADPTTLTAPKRADTIRPAAPEPDRRQQPGGESDDDGPSPQPKARLRSVSTAQGTFEAPCDRCKVHLGPTTGYLCDTDSEECRYVLCPSCHPGKERVPLFCEEHRPDWPTGQWTTGSRTRPETLTVNEDGEVSWHWGKKQLAVTRPLWKPGYRYLEATVDGGDQVQITWLPAAEQPVTYDTHGVAEYIFKLPGTDHWHKAPPMQRREMKRGE